MNRIFVTFMRKLLLFLPIFAGTALPARNYYFQHYDKSDGLAHQTVYCAAQDANGFLWFGTKSGLSRFDGRAFKNYINDTGRPYTLPSNTVNALEVSRDGLLWVGTSEGLCLYDPVKDIFSPFQCAEFTITQSIDGLARDKLGNIWAFSWKGVYLFDRDTGINKFFPTEGSYAPTGIKITQSGRVWILGSDGNIHLFDSTKGEIHSYPVLTEKERIQRVMIFRIMECSGGDLLITTNSMGARRFSPDTGEISTLFTKDASDQPIYIHCVMQNGDDEFWFGTETGVHVYKLGTGFTDHLTKSYENAYSLSDNAIHMLMKDREGGIWVGSFFGGLNYLSNDNTLFEKYLPVDGNGHTKANVIREIIPGPDGMLYVGTEDGGLCRFNPVTKEFRTIDLLQRKEDPLSTNIQSLMLEQNRYLWIGTFDRGIYIMDTLTGKIIRHYEIGDPASGLRSGIVCIRQTSREDILVGTTGGVFLFDRGKDCFLPMKGTNGLIHSIFESHDHRIWIGSLGGGVSCINPDSGSLEATDVPFEERLITAIFEDSEDRMWIGTEGRGLYRFDSVQEKAIQVLPADEFPGIIVYQIVEDAMGSLWVTTSDGLLQYDPQQGITHHFTTANGLPIDQFNYNSSYQTRTGTIYLGTLKGMISFSPENIQVENIFPRVFFTGFWLFDKEIEAYQPHSILQQSILYTDAITLKHDQNTLSLSFAAPSFSISQNTWYRYRLEGIENGWNTTYSPRRVYYTKLPPGKYTFRVQASNNSRSWDTEMSSLEITIRHPFWKTPFAYVLYSLVALTLLLYTLIRSRNALRRKETLQLEKMKDEKQKEILQAKISFFTNITHEIRTPLTLIMGSLNRIRKNGRNDLVNDDNVQVMTKNTQRLLDLVNQLLDFRKIESSSFLLNLVLLNLSRLVEDCHTRFTPLAQVKGVDFSLSVPKDNYEITADKEALIKILSNMLSNALKFCEKTVRMTLSDAEVNGESHVRIRVENDGERIPPQEAEEIFKPFYQYHYEGDLNVSKGSGLGLPLARSLAEMMGGHFYLDETVSDYNSFVLDLPLEPVENHETETETVLPVKEEDTGIPVDFPHQEKHAATLLVVEDDLDIRKFIAEELADRYSILQAGDGREALDLLENHVVSLIISDLMMPVMDGVSFCKSVKSNIKFCHIPIIVLTAKVSLQAHLDVLDAKADAYIEKPFSTEHLVAQVSNLLANRELMRSTFIRSPYAHLSSVASNATDERFLEKMNKYVMTNLSDPSLSVESLAEYMNMSLSTLYRKVKSTTSLSPSDFIRLCRLKKAAELLSEGDMRINEVAEYLSFTSPSYFTTCFTKQFGITPSDFVKRNQP